MPRVNVLELKAVEVSVSARRAWREKTLVPVLADAKTAPRTAPRENTEVLADALVNVIARRADRLKVLVLIELEVNAAPRRA